MCVGWLDRLLLLLVSEIPPPHVWIYNFCLLPPFLVILASNLRISFIPICPCRVRQEEAANVELSLDDQSSASLYSLMWWNVDEFASSILIPLSSRKKALRKICTDFSLSDRSIEREDEQKRRERMKSDETSALISCGQSLILILEVRKRAELSLGNDFHCQGESMMWVRRGNRAKQAENFLCCFDEHIWTQGTWKEALERL